MEKIEFECGFPKEGQIHKTKGDGSSKLIFDISEMYLREANTIAETMREKPLRVVIEVIGEYKPHKDARAAEEE